MLPNMPADDKIQREIQQRFAGLDRRKGAAAGYLASALNLTLDEAPLLATRRPRHPCGTHADPLGLTAEGGLCYAADGCFYDGETCVCEVAESEKNIVEMGKLVLIFPDKLCYDRESGEVTELESAKAGQNMCFFSGTLYGEAAEANAIRLTGVCWSDYFKAGDAVKISGCTRVAENNKTAVIREVAGDELHFSENCFSLDGQVQITESGTVTLERKLPDMDALCVHDNRLFGAKGDTVYASALGDPTNFNRFDGTGTDSFAVSTGTAGDFTACASFLGCPVFFKEQSIFKLYGDRPENFQLMRTVADGVGRGNRKSVAVAGETCFYAGTDGVYAYRGGMPRRISDALGDLLPRDAVGGSDGRHYCLACRNGTESAQELFVYRIDSDGWTAESAPEVFVFSRGADGLYAFCRNGELFRIAPETGGAETNIAWQADFTEESDLVRHRYLHRLILHIRMAAGSTAQVSVSCDGGAFTPVCSLPASAGICNVPVPLNRVTRAQIRLAGTGAMTLYAVERQYAVGSER